MLFDNDSGKEIRAENRHRILLVLLAMMVGLVSPSGEQSRLTILSPAGADDGPCCWALIPLNVRDRFFRRIERIFADVL
jgi:hypothetical protein